MVAILTNLSFSQDTRCLALEYLVSFIEEKPTFMAKFDGFAKSLLEVLINMMLDVVEVPFDVWNAQEDNEEEGTGVTEVAQVYLSSFSRIVFPLLRPATHQSIFLTSCSWHWIGFAWRWEETLSDLFYFIKYQS